MSVLFINRYQYFKVFLCDMSTFYYTNKPISLVNIFGKIKAMFQKINFRNEIALVIVLQNVFIVSYGIVKCIREITRGSVMCCYLTFIW